MKRIVTLYCLLTSICVLAQNPTVLHINFVSHNEESPSPTTGEPNWSNTFIYQLYRGYIKAIADTIEANGGKWNWQSDWKFLTSVLDTNKETSTIKLTTGGQDIVKYLDGLSSVEVDAHAHQSTHNYADVAKLLDSLGVTAITVGGFLYDTVVAPIIPGKNWSDFENGINGLIYSSFLWKPEILWGASTVNHTNVENYGAWRPDTMKNFFTDNSNRNLLFIGNGCDVILDSGFVASTVIQDITNAIVGLNNNFSSSDFFSATIMMNQRDFDDPQYAAKLGQIIRGLNTFVSQGKLNWLTLSEKRDEWVNNYGNPSDAHCSLVVASAKEIYNDKKIIVFPNPAISEVTFHILGTHDLTCTVELYDLHGRLTSASIGNNIINMPVDKFPAGLYNYIIKNDLGEIVTRGKIAVVN